MVPQAAGGAGAGLLLLLGGIALLLLLRRRQRTVAAPLASTTPSKVLQELKKEAALSQPLQHAGKGSGAAAAEQAGIVFNSNPLARARTPSKRHEFKPISAGSTGGAGV